MTHADRWNNAMVPNYGTPTLHLASGDGSFVTDVDGNTYLDLLAGLAVNILGHAHPRIVAAVHEQTQTLGHVSNLYATEPALRLAERLSNHTYGHKAALLNSGSEANELAYKICRRYAHRKGQLSARVLAFEGSFHGRTTAALALTGQPGKQEGFGPFPEPIEHVPYDDSEALEAAFEEGPVAGVFVEYVQGEGGIRTMPKETSSTLHRMVDEHDALLVADEVQTGLGRTGRFFAHQHHGVKPDIVTMAKALGGGLPAAACLVREDVAGLMGPGSHGCTFGGNPIACAAANAVLDVYEEEGLGERARRLGGRFMDALSEGGDGVTPRGQGLLLGLPVGAPVAQAVQRKAREEGVLMGRAGDGVVRLAPPLVVDEEALMGAVPTIQQAVRRFTQEAPLHR